jgi:S1/P1 Nuclease
MKRILYSVAILVATSLCGQASAWGPAGHKIVAAIAFRQLTPEQQKKIVAILKQHPRFHEDFEDRMTDGVEENEWYFHQAAVWPDIAKTLPHDLKAEYSRPEWHYINLPYFPTDDDRHELEGHLSLNTSFDPPTNEDEKMNVVQATRFAQRVLANPHASKSDKALYLSWLFHLVGDAHQPLHAATLCMVEIFPGGDHGGNWIPTSQSNELHALWDGFPGSPRIKFRAVQQGAIKLALDHDLKQAGEKAATDPNVEVWVKESFDLAAHMAYTNEVLTHLEGETDHKKLPPLELSEEYLSDGGNVAKQRVVEAGYRLGAMLKKIADE